jgi:Cu2+-exporting ATPase
MDHSVKTHNKSSMMQKSEMMDDHHNHNDHHSYMITEFKKRFWISLALTIPILLLSPIVQEVFGIKEQLHFNGDRYILLIISTIIFFYGGNPFLKGMYQELKEKLPGMMTLIGLAIIVSYLYSAGVVLGISGNVFFWELVTLIDIMLLGHWIEMRSVVGASRALDELARLMPKTAHKLKQEGRIEDVLTEDLQVNDNIIIKPGEKVPVDGRIIEGETSINESMLTGESKPITKQRGSEVIGGSVNGEGSVTVKITKLGKDSYLSQITELVKQAQETKSKTQDIANRVAVWLTIIAITVGILTFFVWTIIEQKDFSFALGRTVSVMVITCPHALGLAIPLVVAVSTTLGARNGFLIRNRTAFEKARNIDAIVFDKTGTLTEGIFGIKKVISFSNKIDEAKLLFYAASVESRSEHPIAKAIVQKSKQRMNVKNFKAFPGKGAEGNVNGMQVKVISQSYLQSIGKFIRNNEILRLQNEGNTVIYIMIEDKLRGAIVVSDIVRSESEKAITQLKNLGIKTIMITGDSKPVAKSVAEELGIDEYFSEILPDQKAKKIKEIQKTNETVAMIGDGVNDAPALAQADVGIAIGAGTDVAIETADLILVKNNLLDVVTIIQLARQTYKKIVQNLLWATGYNALSIPLAAGVLYNVGIILNPAVGALFMSLSTVIVALNARLLKLHPTQPI